MRQTIIAAAAAFIVGGAATGAVLSQAQPATPPAPVQVAPPAPPPPWMRPDMRPEWHHDWHQRPFALIYRAPDRNLSPSDVQAIVQGFLLWNGNHTWKVADVTPISDGLIGFTLTTDNGSAIAKFTMNPHTGRIARIG